MKQAKAQPGTQKSLTFSDDDGLRDMFILQSKLNLMHTEHYTLAAGILKPSTLDK